MARPSIGIIRREDVRAIDKDNIQMYKSFRPGDIILAKVVSFILKKIYVIVHKSIKFK